MDMGDAAQWVRGLVGRRGGAASAGGQPSTVGAPAAPASVPAETAPAGSQDRAMTAHSRWHSSWRLAPVLAASMGVLGILALFWPTVASIVAIWIRSETFTHGFVVVPICLWLVWRRRETVASIPARPWWPGLAIVFVAGGLWFVTSLADVLGVKQFALVFMLQAAIVTVLGTGVARATLFPLAFLLFAVPFGEIFVPTLIDWTADFTVAALRWSGVPVYREGNLFMIPSGVWSVVETCSGIRYIIASLMVGTIYAAVAYRSTRRRAMFIAAAILVPIVANWLRAYLIVMLGHLSNNKLAVGIDHIIYGWVFFGLVMLLLFWVGSFWQEEAAPLPESRPAPSTAESPRPGSQRSLFTVAILAVMAAGIWLPLEAAIDHPGASGAPVIPPIASSNGWAAVPAGLTDWQPHYGGYVAESRQTFRKDGSDIGLYIAYYRDQGKGHELITSTNQLVEPADWKWKRISSGGDSIRWENRPARVDRSDLAGRTTDMQAFSLFWVDGRVTSSQYVAKALQAWSKLSGRGDDAALIVIYAARRRHDDDRRPSLRAFAQEMSPSIERTLDATRDTRG
jgi:exosortase A